jgi:hypothetical protein
MISLLIKLALALVGLTALLLGMVRAYPAHDDDLRRVLLPAPGCPAPCWQGIVVDVTTREEATAILEADPWVKQVYQTPLAVTWSWNGSQPALINGAQDGLLQIGGGVVRQIRIQTRIPFGDVWLALDRPDDARLLHPITPRSAYQIAAYEEVGIQSISAFDCPVKPPLFWQATITLGMGRGWKGEALSSRTIDIYRTPSWWWRLRDC